MNRLKHRISQLYRKFTRKNKPDKSPTSFDVELGNLNKEENSTFKISDKSFHDIKTDKINLNHLNALQSTSREKFIAEAEIEKAEDLFKKNIELKKKSDKTQNEIIQLSSKVIPLQKNISDFYLDVGNNETEINRLLDSASELIEKGYSNEFKVLNKDIQDLIGGKKSRKSKKSRRRKSRRFRGG